MKAKKPLVERLANLADDLEYCGWEKRPKTIREAINRLRDQGPPTIAAIVREQQTGEPLERFYCFGDVDQARRFQAGATEGVARFLEKRVERVWRENKGGETC